MKHRFIVILSALLFVCVVHGGDMRELSFYCPLRIHVPPVIDGMLDDACWQQTPSYTATYEYFKPRPGPGVLKNAIRLAYDDFGLYLAIVNYEAHPENIRMDVMGRDSSHLWQDDCAEIYLDCQPNGPGYRKFTVNARAVLADVLQVDGSVSLEDWNASGWRCQTKILPDRWHIECFFPWEDLGKKASAGQIWRFCHTRYAWPHGRFVGTTSSPGGNYSAIDNFGYLCFLDAGASLSKAELGKLFSRLVTPPWGVVLGEELLYDLGKGVQLSRLSDMVKDEIGSVRGWLLTLGKDPGKELQAYEALLGRLKTLEGVRNKNFDLYRQLLDVGRAVRRHYWRRQLDREFS